jgi:arylsulfatase A-like enzyme
MNFQTVSTAQKLPVSDGLNGGYLPGTSTPGPLLRRALDYIDTEVGSMIAELQARGLARSTAIILSAKHGQSPIDPSALTRIDDGPIIAGINAAWAKTHPGATLIAADPGDNAAGSRDDAFPLWLTDRSPAATQFVKDYLFKNSATGNTYNVSNPATAGPSRTLPHSGLRAIHVGAAAARYFGVPVSDPRHPDVWGVVQHGVVYTGKTGKIAEHGGADIEDRHVPLVVYAPGAERGSRVRARVIETTSIAPSILSLLGLDPNALQAVRIEGTPALPGLK